MTRALVLPAVLSSLLLGTACGTLRGSRGWGQDACIPVRGDRVASAAKRALLDPVTWVPAAGAVVFAIGDLDSRTSDWAADRNPIFGSAARAQGFSDEVRGGLVAEAFVLALVTPSGDEAGSWTLAKARGIAVEAAALEATFASTALIKRAAGRERPDGSDRRSFPSAHSSSAFAAARLANRNLESLSGSRPLRSSVRALQAANLTLAAAVAYARVEGRNHYPSDVLAGAALGNFLSAFVHDAFMNLPPDEDDACGLASIRFAVSPSGHGWWGAVAWRF